jgi:protein-tyrosine phosphatase
MARAWKPVVVGVVAVALFAAWPFAYFRYTYAHGKRLREVVPGKVYRSGQLTAEGFADAVKQFGIRTIVNVQDEWPDPDIDLNFWTRETIKEKELCHRLNVNYVHLAPDLVSHDQAGEKPPAVLATFLELMDRESTYPVLIHCRAGLHRTGVLCAVYRMEYQGWTPDAAFRELKAHGFGEFACTAANDYVYQYVLTYRPRARQADKALAHGPRD